MNISRFCKSCGAKISIDDSAEKFFCSFCGAENTVDSPDSINSTVLQPKNEQITQPLNSAFHSPSQGNYSNHIYNPTYQKSGPSTGKIIGIVCGVIALFFFISFIGGIFSAYLKAARRAREATNTTAAQHSASENTLNETQTVYSDSIVGNKTSFKDLKIGEIGKKGDVYVGLQYVKSSSTLPTRVNPSEPTAGKTVILAFFEFYNGSSDTIRIDPSSITCYVDGVQATGVQTYFKVYADGIHQYYSTQLDSTFQLLSVQDFEVPEEWQEIKFFYQSDCTWTISKNNVSEEPYKPKSLITVNRNLKETKINDLIVSGSYDVQYKGAEIFCDENYYIGDLYYVVFKFNITNNSNKALDTSSLGRKMRGYQNNCFLGDTERLLDDTIDGYIDINNIDSIEPGMSANVYIAFETIGKTQAGRFIMIYDVGNGTEGVTHIVIS